MYVQYWTPYTMWNTYRSLASSWKFIERRAATDNLDLIREDYENVDAENGLFKFREVL
jgi:putative alpha-1,2-mannosidase